jgi:preprotein translocase SecE subunit
MQGTHASPRDEVDMAGKSKKRKPQPQAPRRAPEQDKSEAPAQEAPPVAVARVASAPAVTEAKKTKPAKPAPVLTKKPSRLRFFVDAVAELRRAHWPSRREAVRLSLMVAAVCFVVGVILGGLDFVFTRLVGLLLVGS